MRGFTRMATEKLRASSTRRDAARRMFFALADMGVKTTPDGARYNVRCIQEAMTGWER